MITWGHDIQVTTVPTRYWTNTLVKTIYSESSTEKKQSKLSKDVRVESKFELSKDVQVKSKFKITPAIFLPSNDNSSLVFTKAIYNKPDLLKVARHDRANLTPLQQAQLFQILASNNKLFKGGLGH
jgi:hypothetical protein